MFVDCRLYRSGNTEACNSRSAMRPRLVAILYSKPTSKELIVQLIILGNIWALTSACHNAIVVLEVCKIVLNAFRFRVGDYLPCRNYCALRLRMVILM